MSRKETKKRLRVLMTAAYNQRKAQAPEPGEAWRDRVMNNLPGMAPQIAAEDRWAVMERLVWRLVPAAGVVALLLAVLVFQAAPEPTGDLASLMTSEVTDTGLYTYFQSEKIQ